MNLARVSETGQVTIPAEIRRLLSIRAGDKVFFIPNGNGEVVLTMLPLKHCERHKRRLKGWQRN